MALFRVKGLGPGLRVCWFRVSRIGNKGTDSKVEYHLWSTGSGFCANFFRVAGLWILETSSQTARYLF